MFTLMHLPLFDASPSVLRRRSHSTYLTRRIITFIHPRLYKLSLSVHCSPFNGQCSVFIVHISTPYSVYVSRYTFSHDAFHIRPSIKLFVCSVVVHTSTSMCYIISTTPHFTPSHLISFIQIHPHFAVLSSSITICTPHIPHSAFRMHTALYLMSFEFFPPRTLKARSGFGTGYMLLYDWEFP